MKASTMKFLNVLMPLGLHVRRTWLRLRIHQLVQASHKLQMHYDEEQLMHAEICHRAQAMWSENLTRQADLNDELRHVNACLADGPLVS